MSDAETLLPDGLDVPFSAIESAQLDLRGAEARALIGTVIVVAPRARVAEAAEALEELGSDAGMRAILIAEGSGGSPRVRVAADAILLDGVRPEYVNNAVAALRLSSLPSLVWWRGGTADVLPGLATLADRLVIDVEDPEPIWVRVAQLAKQTAITDIRWAKLTRWRRLMAQFFDIEEVRVAAGRLQSLHIDAEDVATARLFAGWLVSSLPRGGDLKFDVRQVPDGAAIGRVRLGIDGLELTLALTPSRTCVVTSAQFATDAPAESRTVSLGEHRLSALIAAELRIRSRDMAFERAVRALEGKS